MFWCNKCEINLISCNRKSNQSQEKLNLQLNKNTY